MAKQLGRRAEHGEEEDPLQPLRHSSAHLMAGAVMDLFPGTKLGIGPAIRDGFYYDFALPRPLAPEDLGRIEARMREVAGADVPFERSELSRDEGIRLFEQSGQDLKVDLIRGFEVSEGAEADTVSVYKHDGFVDLCKGPHVDRTGRIAAFKLMSIAGAYWRGDETRPQLTRIYGTVWPSQRDLDAYLERLKEIQRRDHRVLGRDLELFRIDDELGSGLVLWLPRLSVVREELETWWRRVHHERGYTLVYTPHIAGERIYQRSGHLEKYGENMYGPLLLDDDRPAASTESAAAGMPGRAAAHTFWIKPMNCPGHIKVFQARIRSYRELPLRIGELGTVYRYERGGTLHGMQRVRGFTQDDSHIFCTWDQAQAEIGKVFDLAMEFMGLFGYSDPVIYLSTRPERRLGTDETWDRAEGALRAALGVREVPYRIDRGGGVFYAPKIDIKVMDAIGREWQGPTIQIDLNLPERFDVTFVNDRGERERAVMIHRVLFGSMERFVGGLIEHYAGSFPLWLNWEQVAVVPIREDALDYARHVTEALRSAGHSRDAVALRVHLDEPPLADMRERIREAQHRRASYILVVGGREAESGTVSVRPRGAAKGQEERGVPLDDFIRRVVAERDRRALPADFSPAGPSVGDTLQA